MGTESGATVRASGEEPIKIFTEKNQQLMDVLRATSTEAKSSHTEIKRL
ncbi:MAG: hypothetical protein R2688_10785 [Fimbriimonadaceae bacterium]